MSMKSKPIFTGGDDLTGIYKLYHEAMMKNELVGGYGAYELSYAGGESGFSFGGNQIDLSQRTKFANIIVDILENATNDKGENILTQEEVLKVSGEGNKNLIISQQTLQSVFGNHLEKIQAALSSEYGISKINELYLPEIKADVKHIENAIEGIKNPAAKAFYGSDVGKLLLFDYNNQFRLSLDGALLQKYLDGVFNDDAKLVYSAGEKIVAPINEYTIEHHKKYIYSTKQYAEHQEDCVRRLNNLDAIIENYKNHPEQYFSAKKIAVDFAFLKTTGGKWKILNNVELPKFDIPAPQSKTVVPHTIQFDNPLVLIVPNNSPLKGMPDFYYYFAEEKRLIYVSSTGTYPPAIGDNYDRDWSLIVTTHTLSSPVNAAFNR